MLIRLPIVLVLFLLSTVSCGDNLSKLDTIADHIRGESRFSELRDSLEEADMLSQLDGPGPFTVFAPINGAFHPGSDPSKLAEFLGYHIHDGTLTTEQLERLTATTTITDSEIHVRFGLDGILLNDGVKITSEPVVTDNGIIHVLDGSLLRPLITTTKTYERNPVLPVDFFASDFVVVEDTGFIHNLRVFIDIEHQNVSNLLVFLENLRTGTSISLVERPRSRFDDMDFIFADSSEFDVVDDVATGGTSNNQAYPKSTYRPNRPLETLVGQSIEGEWRLTVINLNQDEEKETLLVRWGMIATIGETMPAPAIVIDPRIIRPAAYATSFTEVEDILVSRVGGLTGEVQLQGNAGSIVGVSQQLTEEENVGSVLFSIPDTTQLGELTVVLSASSGDVSRIVTSTVNVVAPDASGIELLSHVPLPALGAGGSSGSDVWGWTDPTTGAEIAIMGTSQSTVFVDVSQPDIPVVLGALPTRTFASTWRDIKVYQNHAYIVSEAEEHGLQIFDLTTLRDVTAPQTFAATAHINIFGAAHNIAINEDTALAYVVGSDFPGCFGGILTFDLIDPSSPQTIGCFSGDTTNGQAGGGLYPRDVYTHDIQCVTYTGPDTDYQGREICISSDEQSIGIADFDDPGNPAQIVRVTYEDVGYTHQGWLTEDQQYFIMNDEFDESDLSVKTRSYVWDVRDLDSPEFIGFIENPRDAVGHNTYILGDIAYQANYTSGLRLVDISSIASGDSFETAYYDTHPDDDHVRGSCDAEANCGVATYDGAWSTYPYFASGVILVSDIQRGLFVLRRAP